MSLSVIIMLPAWKQKLLRKYFFLRFSLKIFCKVHKFDAGCLNRIQ